MSTHRKGLTLIEVLIIVVICAILLTIVIQRLNNRPLKETTSALQADVRNAREAESQYFTKHQGYGTLAQLDSAGIYSPIPGHKVTIAMTATGYTAAAIDSATSHQCTLTVSGGESAAGAAQPVCQ